MAGEWPAAAAADRLGHRAAEGALIFQFSDFKNEVISKSRCEMELNPPAGSKISIIRDGVDPTIVIPAAGGSSRYFIGLFMLFWLGMWQIGFRDAASKVLAGNAPAFLIFWLGGWTLGGVAAVYTLFRIFRPSMPETLTLRRSSISYDSGVAPPQFNSYRRNQNPISAWRSTFPKRVRAEIERKQLQSLRLRETEAGNRLTMDLNATRLDLASTASEVEREWLAGVLARRYSLSQVSGNAANNA
jgi:hypothetical protein